jgi:hypothetical protein
LAQRSSAAAAVKPEEGAGPQTLIPTAKAVAFFEYARKRQEIFLRRQAGAPPPWTSDPILRAYRFCNVFREDDAATRWLRLNISEKLGDKPGPQVRAATVFRLTNRVETGDAIGDLLLGKWDLKELGRRLRSMVRNGEHIIGPAYCILTPPGLSKADGLVKVLSQMEGQWGQLGRAIKEGRSLELAWLMMREFKYIGSFMSYEIVTDLNHTPVLEDARDVLTWANPGPGAARGLARLWEGYGEMGRTSRYGSKAMNLAMRHLLSLSVHGSNWPQAWPQWDMRTVEHNLCEFDKYERTRLGEGRPKRLFR